MAVERLLRVMDCGSDGALSPVHWSCNIPPGLHWQLQLSFFFFKGILVINLRYHFLIHKTNSICLLRVAVSLCNCGGQSNVKLDHFEFLYESYVFI